MLKKTKNEYTPDYVTYPGTTLLETIEYIEMSQTELSKRTGLTRKVINEIINNKAPITYKTALNLEKVLHIPASFWNNRERLYREYLASLRERKYLEKQKEWLEKFPLKEMIKEKWIDNSESLINELLSFFRVASPNDWNNIWLNTKGAFRISNVFNKNPYSISVWICKGEIEGRKIDCSEFNKKEFENILPQIRELTLIDNFSIAKNELVELCASLGVAVVFIPELPHTHVSGYTCMLAPDKALIQLSLRYKSDDQFWFSFFHETCHIIKHSKKDVFIEIYDADNIDDEKENEANKFAENILIPKKEWNKFIKKRKFYKNDIINFAYRISISPGIIAGRLQKYNYIKKEWHNDLKKKYKIEYFY